MNHNEERATEECLKTKFHSIHWKDIMASGLYGETIRKAGIRSVPPGEIPRLLGWNPLQVESALVFPYPGKNSFFRMKVFPAYKDKDGHTVKYLQRGKEGPYLYFPPGIKEALEDPSVPLLITEGEKKALKATQEGFHPIGVGGCWNFLKDGRHIEDLDLIQWQGRQVSICFDSDALEKIEEGRLQTAMITEKVNEGVSEKWQRNEKSVGKKLRAMGLKKGVKLDKKATVIIEPDTFKKTYAKYLGKYPKKTDQTDQTDHARTDADVNDPFEILCDLQTDQTETNGKQNGSCKPNTDAGKSVISVSSVSRENAKGFFACKFSDEKKADPWDDYLEGKHEDLSGTNP